MTIATYHVDGNDFTVGLLDFSNLGQKVPEAGFGDDGVLCEYAHAVELGGWVGIGGQVAANDLVFLETSCGEDSCQSTVRNQYFWRPARG